MIRLKKNKIIGDFLKASNIKLKWLNLTDL